MDHTQHRGSTLRQIAERQQSPNLRLPSTKSDEARECAASYIQSLIDGNPSRTGIVRQKEACEENNAVASLRQKRRCNEENGYENLIASCNQEGLATLFVDKHAASTKAVEEEYGPNPLPSRMDVRPTSSPQIKELRASLFPGRSKMNEPICEESDSAEGGETASHSFLYQGLGDQIRELSVGIKLANSRSFHANSDFKRAYDYAEAATVVASELAYQPLVSRCLYWRAMSLFGLGQVDMAIKDLEDASKAKGRYEEGSLAEVQLGLIDVWRRLRGKPVEGLIVRHMSARSLREEKRAVEAGI